MKRLSILLLIGLSITLSGCSLFKKKQAPETTERKSLINEPVNLIPVSERPFISLEPANSGQEIDLVVHTLNKSAEQAEFELEYNAGDLIRGAFGSIELADLPASYTVLLGSCSTGGTCSYDKDVSGGSAVVSFKGDENYAIKINWRYQEVAVADGKFGTQDQKFQISGDDLFGGSKYVIVSEASGLPEQVEGEILAGPYSIAPSNGLDAQETATVTMRMSQETDAATLWGWDESAWVELESQIEGKTITSEATLYSAYLVTQ